jgi:muconolactone delta-isomerase
VRILAIERNTDGATVEAFTPELLAAEARRAWELHQAGVVRELYFRADNPAAVLVLECPNLDEAGEALASLPLVEAGLIQFDVIPLRAYPGFARLFAGEES